ncbi:MAG: 50S ribosomal protein L44e [Candidatus Bathyarchaeota archaeon]|nr:MAG: 50S ribosomal protein L44e [Candidatus Bathyarchaeota archaeon]
MNVPKKIKTYCPKCHAHTGHAVSLYKVGKRRTLAVGARRHEREKRGYGGQGWPLQKKFAKTTKKQVLKLKCNNCGFILQRKGIRLRKLTIGGRT